MENNADEFLLAERHKPEQRIFAPEIQQYRGVYRTRLILRFLSLATCIAIDVVLIGSIREYKTTKHVTNPFRDGSGRFPVWPEGLKLYPTYLLLGAATIAGFLSLLLIIASFNKTMRKMTKAGNVTTVIVSSLCLIFWTAVTAYYGTWDSGETNWDLLSWSCTHQDPLYDYQNIDFSEFCTEMRFAFWAGVGLAGIEAINLIIFVVWWIGTRRSEGYKKVHEGKDSKTGVELGLL